MRIIASFDRLGPDFTSLQQRRGRNLRRTRPARIDISGREPDGDVTVQANR